MKQNEREKGPIAQDAPSQGLTTDDNDGSQGKDREEVKPDGKAGKAAGSKRDDS